MSVILGIDPGSRTTGYGVIQRQGSSLNYLASGSIHTSAAKNFSEKLQLIYSGIHTVIGQFSPKEVAIEQVFVAYNVSSALKLGQARGVAIVAAVNAKTSLFEYAARQIKQSVAGSGTADKGQVQYMVKLLLNLSMTPAVDAADALAVAITHVHYSKLYIKNSCLANVTSALKYSANKNQKRRTF